MYGLYFSTLGSPSSSQPSFSREEQGKEKEGGREIEAHVHRLSYPLCHLSLSFLPLLPPVSNNSGFELPFFETQLPIGIFAICNTFLPSLLSSFTHAGYIFSDSVGERVGLLSTVHRKLVIHLKMCQQRLKCMECPCPWRILRLPKYPSCIC